MKLTCVISGGQTGADIGGLAAAKSMEIPTGGWMPRGWITEEGPHPEYAQVYGMKECAGGHNAASAYAIRTLKNILDADATLIVASQWGGRGTALTLRHCEDHNKPNFAVHVAATGVMHVEDYRQNPRYCAMWLRDNKVRVLNVAGNRESKCPGLARWTYDYLRMVFSALYTLGTEPINPMTGGSHGSLSSPARGQDQSHHRPLHVSVWPAVPSGLPQRS